MTPPPIPNPPYGGGCLCGDVRYSLTARPLAINACHCTDCHKLSGATNLLMLLMSSGAFTHDRGEVERWRKTADSGRQVDLVRCKTCGVRLWHEALSSPEYTFIAAGTLDDPHWAFPTSHIWTSKKLPLAHIPDGLYAVAGQPTARQDLIDAFARIHGA